MELKKIQYFLRIVDQGGLSRAAESLYLTQPTLSRFLARLEEEAGVKLFRRERDNSLTLTEAGTVYLETARKMDALWNQMQAELAALRGNDGEAITLGVDADSLLSFASECAEQIGRSYPAVSVRIHRLGAFEIQQQVTEGTLDFGLTAYEEENEQLHYIQNRCTKVDLVVGWENPLAARSYRLPGQEQQRIRLEELGRETPFVLIRKTTVLRQLEDAVLKQLPYEPKVVATYDQHRSAVDMVAGSSDLVAFCPSYIRSSRVAFLALEQPFFYKYGICYRKKEVLTDAKRKLIELLKAQPHTRDLDK